MCTWRWMQHLKVSVIVSHFVWDRWRSFILMYIKALEMQMLLLRGWSMLIRWLKCVPWCFLDSFPSLHQHITRGICGYILWQTCHLQWRMYKSLVKLFETLLDLCVCLCIYSCWQMMWSGLHIGSMLFQFSTDSACLLFMLFMFLWLLDLWTSSTIYCQSILNHFRAIGKAFEAICGCITHVSNLKKIFQEYRSFWWPRVWGRGCVCEWTKLHRSR